MRNQGKDNTKDHPVKKEEFPSPPVAGASVAAVNESENPAQKNNYVQSKGTEVKDLEKHVMNGASVSAFSPLVPPGLLGPSGEKISRSKMVAGHDSKIFPAQPLPVRLPAPQSRRHFSHPNLQQPHSIHHQHMMKRSYRHHHHQRHLEPPRGESQPGGASGRPSVIQHTAKHGPPTSYGHPGVVFPGAFDAKKRPFPFGDPCSSAANERQPFPTPPPAHSNSYRGSLPPSDLRNFRPPVDSIKRLRMNDNNSSTRSSKYSAPATATQNDTSRESLEPMDFSSKKSARSEDEPLCLVTHNRKDRDQSSSNSSNSSISSSSSSRRPPLSFTPWQHTVSATSSSSSSSSSKGASHTHSARSVNHAARSKHDIPDKASPSSSRGSLRTHGVSGHVPSSSAGHNHRLPASAAVGGAGYLFSPPPAPSISAGLPAHTTASSNSSSSRSSNSSATVSHTQQQQQQQQAAARSSSTAAAKSDPKVTLLI